jgi:tRNA pseudouridine38-40 synthase
VRAYRLAYDGTPYHGFQRQPAVDTVEDRLCEALAALDITDGDVPPGYAGAGRTDAGVSALAQTVAFEAPQWLSPQAFNSELPETIRVWATADVPDSFHATHDARSREYTYVLSADGVDESRLDAVLDGLSGSHDFHNLTLDDTGTRRDLTVTFERDDQFFLLRFRASGFPRQFVRRAVTLVADIASGERSVAFLDRVLAEEPLPGPDGIGPAPPAGLVLTDVFYRNIEFTADTDGAATTQQFFEQISRQHAVRSRVSALLAEAGTPAEE